MASKSGSGVKGKKTMNSPKTRGGGSSTGISITSDWVKTIIAIIVQSVAVGFYIASVKSDLGHLTDDFKEFKIRMEADISDLRQSVGQIVMIKSKMENMADDSHRGGLRIDGLEKEIQSLNQKIFDMKEQVKDSERSIDRMKENETTVKELKLKLESMRAELQNELLKGLKK